MATKSLQRTIVEGGRANKWERKNSYRKERTSERNFCKKAQVDPEIFYERNIEKKEKVYKKFNDKLSPANRWLKSYVGQNWDQIYSKIKRLFDIRTTKGRHLVLDHLVGPVEIFPNLRFPPQIRNESISRNDFYVDDEGNLSLRSYKKT